MKIDFKKGFTFAFKEEDWLPKIAIGSALVLLAIIINLAFSNMTQIILLRNSLMNVQVVESISSLVGVIFILPISVLIAGYVLNSARNEINSVTPLLPEWSKNWITYARQGFYLTAATFLYGLMYLIVFFTTSVGMGILLAHFGFNKIIVLSIFTIYGILITAIYSLIVTSASLFYIDSLKFSEAFNFKAIYQFISKIWIDLIKIGLVLILAFILCALILTFSCIGIVFLPILVFLAKLIAVNLYAQVYKSYKNKLNNSAIQGV